MQVLLDSARLNLWASCIAALTGFVLLRKLKQQLEQKSPDYLQSVLVLWILQWFVLILVYVVLGFDIQTEAAQRCISHIVLALVDLGTLASLWISIILFRGKAQGAISGMAVLYICFLGWNFSFAATNSWQFRVLSDLLILVSFLMVFPAFYRRFGAASISYILVRLFGFVLQFFTYRLYFQQNLPPRAGEIQLAYFLLALMKLLSAYVFYRLLSSSDIEEYSLWRELEDYWRRLEGPKAEIVKLAGKVLIVLILILAPWYVLFQQSVMLLFPKLEKQDFRQLALFIDQTVVAVVPWRRLFRKAKRPPR